MVVEADRWSCSKCVVMNDKSDIDTDEDINGNLVILIYAQELLQLNVPQKHNYNINYAGNEGFSWLKYMGNSRLYIWRCICALMWK